MKKNIFLTLILTAIFNINYAEPPATPQKVYSIVKQIRSLDWYKTQANLWEKELNKNKTNSDAWLNYYTASRMIKLTGGNITQKDLDNIVHQMEKFIPGTFEYHYTKYWNGHNNPDLFEHLQKAYELAPERPETYNDFVTYYELQRNKEQVKKFCNLLFESNDISANLYAWNYNVLVSTDHHSILITNGDNDTYPAMVLQHAKDIRKDVALLNINLLTIKSYRDKYFNELGIPLMATTENDYKNYQEYTTAICRHIFDHSGKNIYFPTSIAGHIYENFKEDLYSVGLAFRWTDEKFDNIAVMKKNYEKHYLKDYLKVELFNDISETVHNRMSASYLMSLITLHNHYEESEENSNLKETESLIYKIAKKSGKTKEVEEVLHDGDKTISLTIDDPREALKGFLEINDTLWASQTEIKNVEYERFLMDLLKQKKYTELNQSRINSTDWRSLLDDRYKHLPDDKIFEHGHPTDDDFPVCNISYKGAVLYCE